jgi:hypothetical protein
MASDGTASRVRWWVDENDVIHISADTDPALAILDSARRYEVQDRIGGPALSVSPRDKTPTGAVCKFINKLRSAVGDDDWNAKRVKTFVANGVLIVDAPDDVHFVLGQLYRRWYWRGMILGQTLKRWRPIALRTLIAVLGVVGAYAFYVQRKFKRDAALAVCDHCGYDLRATPDRCPECGRATGG